MQIPVYYDMEDCSDDYFSSWCCSNCGQVLYDDRIGWFDDPDDNLGITEHAHKVGDCQTESRAIRVWCKNDPRNCPPWL